MWSCASLPRCFRHVLQNTWQAPTSTTSCPPARRLLPRPLPQHNRHFRHPGNSEGAVCNRRVVVCYQPWLRGHTLPNFLPGQGRQRGTPAWELQWRAGRLDLHVHTVRAGHGRGLSPSGGGKSAVLSRTSLLCVMQAPFSFSPHPAHAVRFAAGSFDSVALYGYLQYKTEDQIACCIGSELPVCQLSPPPLPLAPAPAPAPASEPALPPISPPPTPTSKGSTERGMGVCVPASCDGH